MRTKDFDELKKLGEIELREKLADLKSGLYKLRIQGKMGQLKDTASFARARKDIARVATLLSQMKNEKKT